jgi:hypothetical protein
MEVADRVPSATLLSTVGGLQRWAFPLLVTQRKSLMPMA